MCSSDLAMHRSLVFALILIAGGGLVWLNGDPQDRLTQLGTGIGLALWLPLQAFPGLSSVLLLVPLDHRAGAVLLASLGVLALASTSATAARAGATP